MQIQVGLQSNGCSSEVPQREPWLGDRKCIIHVRSRNIKSSWTGVDLIEPLQSTVECFHCSSLIHRSCPVLESTLSIYLYKRAHTSMQLTLAALLKHKVQHCIEYAPPSKKGVGSVNQPCSTSLAFKGSLVPSTGLTPCG